MPFETTAVALKRRLKAQSYKHSACETTHIPGVNYEFYLHENSIEAIAIDDAFQYICFIIK